MAAHRYWRLTGFVLDANGPLELSEARLYAAGVLADASAALTATLLPTSGVLGDLRDGLATGIVSWAYELHRQPGFALVWDFGNGGDIDLSNLRLGSGVSSKTYPRGLTAQFSDDGLNWTGSASVAGAQYPGAMSLTTAPIGDSGDANLSAVALLLHCDGASGSATFLDVSPIQKTVESVAGVIVSTAKSRFGGASALFSGSNYLSVPSHGAFDFGEGDWTIEAFVQPLALVGTQCFVSRQEGGQGVAIQLRADGGLLQGVLRGAGGAGLVVLTGGALDATAFQHVAMSRVGATVYMALNGAIVGFGASPANLTPSTPRPMAIGVVDDGATSSFFAGYIDELRITTGVGRYAANFTVPASAFASSAGGGSPFLPIEASPRPILRSLSSVQQFAGSASPDAAASGHLREHTFLDAYNGGLGIIYGTVKEKSTPANTSLRRRVELRDERSRLTIRETWSDAVTGYFEFRGVKEGVPYSTVSYDHLHNYRAAIADNLFAEVLP